METNFSSLFLSMTDFFFKHKIFFLDLFILCEWMFFLQVCVGTMYVPGAPNVCLVPKKDRKGFQTSMELEFWMAVGCHVGSRSQIQVICKNNQCS